MNLAEAESFLQQRIAKRRAQASRFDLDNALFGPQLGFVRDTATFATALCTRRAGKSRGVAAWLLDGPLRPPHAPSLYFTITRKEAKRIIWPVMLQLNREHNLGYEPKESALILKRNGVPSVFLMGVDTRDEIEKARGTGWGRVAGDEAQTLPPYVEDMVNDVLMPSFMDHDGKIRLIGTPGPVPVGYFFDLTRNPAWKHHAWTVWENPYLSNARAKLNEVLAARGVTEDDPSIQREWFGRWVYDPNALVFRFDATKNTHTELPACLEPWQHVMGIDLGYDDADAVAIIAFNEQRPDSYLVVEIVEPKQTITQLAGKIQALIDKYDPVAVVCDTGGLGKKIVEEMRARYELPIRSAEKTEKFSHIEVLNDAMRSGRFFVPPDSRFGQDAMLVEWDRDKSTSDRLVVSDRYHSDVCDAVLYAFRESQHWMHVPETPPPRPGTAQHEQARQDAYEEHLEEQIEMAKSDEPVWTDQEDDQWP